MVELYLLRAHSPKAADYACALAAGLKVWVLGFEVFGGFGALCDERSERGKRASGLPGGPPAMSSQTKLLPQTKLLRSGVFPLVELAAREPAEDLLRILHRVRDLPRASQEAELHAVCAFDDDRALLTYGLRLPADEADQIGALLVALERRTELSATEFRRLHRFFAALPAQLHPALLGLIAEPHRRGAAHALALMELAAAEAAFFPYLERVLLGPLSSCSAAAAALLEDGAAAAELLQAWRSLPLSTTAAVVSELPPAAAALCVLASAGGGGGGTGAAEPAADVEPAALDAAALPRTYGTLAALAAERCPAREDLADLHPRLASLSVRGRERLSRTLGEAGPLVEAAPHMQVEAWLRLTASMKLSDGRLAIDARKIGAALVRGEASSFVTQARLLPRNPDQHSVWGFVVGWFLLLVSFFGMCEELLTGNLLPFMLDLFLFLSSLLICVLELEITSRLIRDHLALPLQVRDRGLLMISASFTCDGGHFSAALAPLPLARGGARRSLPRDGFARIRHRGEGARSRLT